MKNRAFMLSMLLLLPIFVKVSFACPIPVYQYALEFWEADPYRVTIFYGEEFSPSQQDLIEQLRTNPGKANIALRLVDVDGDMDDITRQHLREYDPPELPWIVLQFPEISWRNNPVWSGPLTGENITSILDSPARSLVADRLVNEVTAVWILLESGNRRRDREAAQLLEREISRLEQTLQLPDPELWWDGAGGVDKEDLPEVKFEMVTISREDPAEKHFIQMLMQSEDGLDAFTNEPMVFPVYGRGIALWAIIGSGINEWTIGEAAEFLTGPCSCQVKLLNPGIDMLLSKDWDREVVRITADIAVPLTGMADFEIRSEEARQQLEIETARRIREETEPDRVVYIELSFDEGGERKTAEAEPVIKGAANINRTIWLTAALVFLFIILTGMLLMKLTNKERR